MFVPVLTWKTYGDTSTDVLGIYVDKPQAFQAIAHKLVENDTETRDSRQAELIATIRTEEDLYRVYEEHGTRYAAGGSWSWLVKQVEVTDSDRPTVVLPVDKLPCIDPTRVILNRRQVPMTWSKIEYAVLEDVEESTPDHPLTREQVKARFEKVYGKPESLTKEARCAIAKELDTTASAAEKMLDSVTTTMIQVSAARQILDGSWADWELENN